MPAMGQARTNEFQNLRRQSAQLNTDAAQSIENLRALHRNRDPNREYSRGRQRTNRANSVNLGGKIAQQTRHYENYGVGTAHHRGDPTLKTSVVFKDGKNKVQKRCPQCQTRNVFENNKKNGQSNMPVQCYQCHFKFIIEIKTRRMDKCPQCACKNQFDIPVHTAKVRVQCYQCKYSFVSLANKCPPPPPERAMASPERVRLPYCAWDWSVGDVCNWIRTMKGMKKYVNSFEQESIDGKNLLEDVDLKLLEEAFEIPKLHAKKILQNIVNLKNDPQNQPKQKNHSTQQQQLSKPQRSNHSQLSTHKAQKVERIKELQAERNGLQVQMLELSGKELEQAKLAEKEISKEIKKLMKKIKKIDHVLKNRANDESEDLSSYSNIDEIENTTPEYDLKSKKAQKVKKEKQAKLDKEFEAKRRRSRQLDQQLEQKRRRLKQMDQRLTASKRDLLSYTAPTPKQTSSSQKRTKESENDDSSDISDGEMMNTNMSGDISDEDDTSTDIEELPSLDAKDNRNNRKSVTNLFFSSLNGNPSPRSSENSDNPRNWTTEQVGDWLQECGFEQYVQDFSVLDINGQFLLSPQVNERFLRNVVHVKPDHLQKLITNLSTLKN